MNLKITKVSSTAKLPTRATLGSAGYDLYANLTSPFLLKAGERALIPTGVAIALQSRCKERLVFQTWDYHGKWCRCGR